jgi:hypothetical protein
LPLRQTLKVSKEDHDVLSGSHRLPAALLVAAIATGLLAVPVAAQQPSVTVNGQPMALSPGALVRQGRVFVPLRGIFERLGAGVVYSAGTINATKGSTTVQLRIGSTQAIINGQPQVLDVAPFIIGATTYVPLRFIAQSLGATVNWDQATFVAAIVLQPPAVAPPPPRPVPPPVRPPPRPVPVPPPTEVRLHAQQPPPGSETRDRFVVISAEFSRPVDPGSVRVWLDGINRTNASSISSNRFSLRPPVQLDFGGHTVRVSGRAPGNVVFDRNWSFTVRRGGQVQIPLTIAAPPAGSTVGRTFDLSGTTIANGRVRVTAGSSPSSFGLFNGNTTAGRRGNFTLSVQVPRALPGQQNITLQITVTDPVSGQSTETTLRLRLGR